VTGVQTCALPICGIFLQLDVVDAELLRQAQAHPERYPNLAVRISGWSARFATLAREWQDMIIARSAPLPAPPRPPGT
jgi:pyruvate-formate lyase